MRYREGCTGSQQPARTVHAGAAIGGETWRNSASSALQWSLLPRVRRRRTRWRARAVAACSLSAFRAARRFTRAQLPLNSRSSIFLVSGVHIIMYSRVSQRYLYQLTCRAGRVLQAKKQESFMNCRGTNYTVVRSVSLRRFQNSFDRPIWLGNR